MAAAGGTGSPSISGGAGLQQPVTNIPSAPGTLNRGHPLPAGHHANAWHYFLDASEERAGRKVEKARCVLCG